MKRVSHLRPPTLATRYDSKEVHNTYTFRDPVSVLPPLVHLHRNLIIADRAITLTDWIGF